MLGARSLRHHVRHWQVKHMFKAMALMEEVVLQSADEDKKDSQKVNAGL